MKLSESLRYAVRDGFPLGTLMTEAADRLELLEAVLKQVEECGTLCPECQTEVNSALEEGK